MLSVLSVLYNIYMYICRSLVRRHLLPNETKKYIVCKGRFFN